MILNSIAKPGIGTYVTTRSISHTSMAARLNSWYQKAKDSAVGKFSTTITSIGSGRADALSRHVV